MHNEKKAGQVIPFPMSRPSKVLQFQIFEEDGQAFGCFFEPDTQEWRQATDRFNDLLDGPGCDQLTYADFERECRSILNDQSFFLDAYAHIAMNYLPPHPLNDIKTAAKWYRKGFKQGMALIPDGFLGRIEWSSLSNRPFLRVHHGLILCALRQKKDKEAIALMEQHLAWNPNDNIGVRYLLGEAYLRKNKTVEARQILEANAAHDGYPPSIYSLALLEFSEGRAIQALTWLRHGIAENPYIAEALNGRIELAPHVWWHGSNFNGPDVVENYLEDAQELWQEAPFALSFLDWAFNCSNGLRERADFVEVNEALAREHDFDVRGQWIERKRALLKKISDETSLEWLKVFKGSNVSYPWERGNRSPRRHGG